MKKYIVLAILLLSIPAFAQFADDGKRNAGPDIMKDLGSPDEMFDSEGWEPFTMYVTKEECEQETGSLCSYATCDYIPKGKTVEEICGDGLTKGWVANTDLIGE